MAGESEHGGPPSVSAKPAAGLAGEEGGDHRATPGMDLAAAVALAILSVLAIGFALALQVPGSLATAPGLFPVLTGASLLAMAAGLGVKARRQGARFEISLRHPVVLRVLADEEGRRVLLLIAIIAAYIVAVDFISFDLRIPTDILVIRFSSYELLTMIALTGILRLFWRATVVRCLLVSVAWSIALATVFRSGFNILLPGSG